MASIPPWLPLTMFGGAIVGCGLFFWIQLRGFRQAWRDSSPVREEVRDGTR